jgi:hypothetical protein
MRPAQGEPCWQETGHIAEHMAQPPLDNAQRPAAGSFPAGVPPGGAFQKRVFRGEDAPRAAATLFNVGGGLVVRPSTHQKRVFRGEDAPRAAATLFNVGGGLVVRPSTHQKRVFRGEDAPRAAATLFNVGGGLVVRPSTHQSCWEAFSGTGRPQASTWILAASELYQGS